MDMLIKTPNAYLKTIKKPSMKISVTGYDNIPLTVVDCTKKPSRIRHPISLRRANINGLELHNVTTPTLLVAG